MITLAKLCFLSKCSDLHPQSCVLKSFVATGVPRLQEFQKKVRSGGGVFKSASD